MRESCRKAFDARTASLREDFASEDAEIERAIKEQELLEKRGEEDRVAMAKRRRAFAVTDGSKRRNREDARR